MCTAGFLNSESKNANCRVAVLGNRRWEMGNEERKKIRVNDWRNKNGILEMG